MFYGASMFREELCWDMSRKSVLGMGEGSQLKMVNCDPYLRSILKTFAPTPRPSPQKRTPEPSPWSTSAPTPRPNSQSNSIVTLEPERENQDIKSIESSPPTARPTANP